MSVEPEVTPFWELRGTTVRAVEAELARLWTAATTENGQGDGLVVTEKGMPHARTSVLNLIVTAADQAASDRILEILLSLGARHPSRAIVLQADPNAEGDTLDARIRTHCRDGDNDGGRICFEQLALTVRGEAARHLDGIVAPLDIHDLPTDVWWPGDPPFKDAVFNQLVEIADRLVVNSADFGDLAGGLKRLGVIRRRSGVGDIAWERLAPWQELTAQFFDAPRFRRYLPNLSRLRIKYAVGDTPAGGTRSPEAGALLYAGWIATRLAWRRARSREGLANGGMGMILEGRYEMVDIGIEPVATNEVPPGELLSVRLRAFGETGSAEFIIDRPATEATIVTNADGMTALLRRIPLEAESEAEVLRRQLVLHQRDPLYEDALRAAAILLAAAQAAAA
ncbi:MAG TPA: glucose-6-phosphate dehydrogenase assembly protein OpcA [Pleomorphomonadaceae bacterium]|nr:glucose-6-phosphate dehydrogenase assembly protein OpcA [Pleomorphomonadaceae bacterium]